MIGKPQLSFREDGTFRVLHLTDIQEGVYPKKDTIRLLNALLDTTKPDLVILTGDQLKGYSFLFHLLGTSSVKKTIHTLLSPMEDRNIFYAVTFGNHDFQSGLSNEEQADIYRNYPHCICPNEGPCAGTFHLSVCQNDGTEKLRFYLLDSGNVCKHGVYAPPSDEVLNWLKSMLFDAQNHPVSVPSVVFQHIPLPEYHKCKNVVLKESVCSPRINAGEFELLRANQNVMSVFCGHDHKNDFFGKVDGISLGYTPSCGFSSYGPGTDRGGRLITFHEDTPMTFETKLLRYCDLIARHTHNRLKEYCDAHIPTCWPNR